MWRLSLLFVNLLCGLCAANLSGPYILWGRLKLRELQGPALIVRPEEKLASLFRESKSIVVFVKNSTTRLDSSNYPAFEELIKNNSWAYLPQRSLLADPFANNNNVEVITLGSSEKINDDILTRNFVDAVATSGEGNVLGILANREDAVHYLAKRQAVKDDESTKKTTTEAPDDEETDKSFVYIADGKKAILYMNSAMVLNLSNGQKPIKLIEHNKAITFDDQRSKGYGRLNIIFTVDGEKIFVRFNFTIRAGTWCMRAVEVEYKEYKNVLSVVRHSHSVPSAPVGFSYRCSAQELIFKDGKESLVIGDYQVQPWLNGASRFSDAYDCVGFTSTPIWSGLLISLLLVTILSIGLNALMNIKTPNRFESSRSKQLTFAVQE